MTDNQFDQLFNMVTKCVGGIQVLQKDVTEIKSDITELKTDVAELKGDVAELKGDVAELKTGQAELKSDVAELKTGQAKLEAGQIRMEQELQKTNKSLTFFHTDLHELRVKVGLVEDRIEGKKQLSN